MRHGWARSRNKRHWQGREIWVFVEMDMKAVEPSTFDFKRLVYRQMIESIKWDTQLKTEKMLHFIVSPRE